MAVQQRARDRVRRARQEAYRDLILEAGERIFGAKGYADAKMAEIALAAGVATGTLYASFPGKRDLYRAIHRENLTELARRYAEIPAALTVRDTILARSEVATRFLTSHPDYLRMYLREAGGWGYDPGAIPADAAAFMDDALYRRGVESGELVDEDPQLLQSLQLASNQVHFTHWLRGGMREDPAALVARVQTHARRALFASEPIDRSLNPAGS